MSTSLFTRQAAPSMLDPNASIACLNCTEHTPLSAIDNDTREQIEHCRRHEGVILLRGFQVENPETFRTFMASFGFPLLSYSFASTPRSQVDGGVYTSTEYPAHHAIPLHNEQAYTRAWPMRLAFYSAHPAGAGGETPVADSRRIYQAIPESIRQAFAERELMYVRNYGNGLDVPWQQVFGTDSREEVAAYCDAQRIDFEWLDDDHLRTRQRCPAVMSHPVSGESVWFNQAHLFHVSALDEEIREVLVETVGEESLPRNTYFGDGTPIPDAMLDEIRQVLLNHKQAFRWQQDDVMLMDNMLFAHAREPFEGQRRVLVAMAEEAGVDRI